LDESLAAKFISKLIKACMRIFISLCILLVITGCGGVGQIRMMPRDGGGLFTGKVVGDGASTATMEISIDGENFTGLFVQSTSNEQFGLVQQFGRGGSSVAIGASVGGTRILKGLFSSSNGRGLRCETTATGNGGAGICVDDKSRVFDFTIHRTGY
jgi:hypothetical protein